MSRTKPTGWRRHSREHSLAAKGIGTRGSILAVRGRSRVQERDNVVGAQRAIEKHFGREMREVEINEGVLKARLGEDNALYVNLEPAEDGIFITEIWLDKKGTGLGSKIVEALTTFAGENDLELYAKHVDNPEFWEKQGFFLQDEENWVYRWEG